jgi:hypothetical protein
VNPHRNNLARIFHTGVRRGRGGGTDHYLASGRGGGGVTAHHFHSCLPKSFPSSKRNTPPPKLPHQDNFSSKPPVEIAGLLTIVPLFESPLPFRPEPLSSSTTRKNGVRKAVYLPGTIACASSSAPPLASAHANLGSAQQLNPRSTAIRAVAKANNLDLEVEEVDTANASAEYLKLNPLSKVPTFVGADGYVLFECIAIAIYSTCSQSGHGWRCPTWLLCFL